MKKISLIVIGVAVGIAVLSILGFAWYKEVNQPDAYSLVGKKLPPFNLLDLEGRLVNSEGLIGKPAVINFWFTTCKPCLVEIPVQNKIKNKYVQEVAFLAITFNNPNQVNHLINKIPFNWTILHSATDYINQITGSYPTTLFVDREGIIQYVQWGYPAPGTNVNEEEVLLNWFTNGIEKIL